MSEKESKKSKKKKKDKDKDDRSDKSDTGKKKSKKDKDDRSDKSDNVKKKSKKDNLETDESKKKKKNKGENEENEHKKKKDKKKSLLVNFSDEPSERVKGNEVERLRKSQYIREEKLKVLRAENATPEELYTEMFAEDHDEKIEALEDEIKKLKRTLEKQTNRKKNQIVPEAKLQMENDWLEVQVREWQFKIESMESKFELVKRAHKNTIDALQQAQLRVTDKKELEEMRQLLCNKKNDLYEATQLIYELQKVAFTMLPPKIAKHCEEVEETMTTAKKRLDIISFEAYRMKMDKVSCKKEISALNLAVEGENELEKIMQKKKSQKQEELDKVAKRRNDLEALIANSYSILEAAGIAYEDALAKAALMPPIELMIDKPKEVKEVAKKKKKEKMESFSETESKSLIVGSQRKSKSKEIDDEVVLIKKDMEKLAKEQQSVMAEVKKVNDMKQEIVKLEKSKQNIGVQLQQEVVLRKTYYNQIEDIKGKIRVFSRCRPISKAELDRGNVQCVKFPDKYTVAVYGVSKDGKAKEFQFDRVFPPEIGQDDVFEDTSRLIQSAFDGYNVCIFAYGQTGSGKTHTLIGNLQTAPGIAPRSFVRLFEVMAEGKAKFTATLKCYMLELYNEKLLDLMTANAEYSDKLEIKKDPHGMVIVPGAELLPAKSSDELRDLFLKGNGNRHIASTKMNSESSRSHLIISMMLECVQHASGKIVRGKMSIIDLAGSERSAKSGVKGVGATEATAINMSLSALGDVISALTSGQPFVPYRNNKLTMLMQDSLGGNSKTLMFVNLSPVDYNATETCNSLVYAQRVKLIKNDATKVADTEETPKLMAIIEKLQSGVKIDDFQNIE